MSKTAAEIEQDIFRSLEASRNYVEQAIQAEIDTWQGPPNLIEAMKYAVMSGGKRIRPVLAIEIARLKIGRASCRDGVCDGVVQGGVEEMERDWARQVRDHK